MKIRPAKRLSGAIGPLAGDKSISHRAGIIAALGRGRSVIKNYSTSADCAATLGCLEQLGVRVERVGSTVKIEGVGARESACGEFAPPLFRQPERPLDCGNSGSTMRMLAGVLASQPFTSTLTGDASLSARPMRRIIEPLERMGARITAKDGHAPLRIEGRSALAPLQYEMPVASAQVKSCILLAALGAKGRTCISEPLATPARDHTERMLGWFGVPVRFGDAGETHGHLRAVCVEGPRGFDARDIDVPGDISSAAFLICAAAALPGSELTIRGVGLNPTRARILTVLEDLGADVRAARMYEQSNEPVGDIYVRGSQRLARRDGERRENILRGGVIAQLIDELPVLAVLGTQVEGGLEIRDDVCGRRAAGRRRDGNLRRERVRRRLVSGVLRPARIVDGKVSAKAAIRHTRGEEMTHNPRRRIVITGFMGAGKTTVASALARLLDCSSVDLDDFITGSRRRTPRELIEEDGEAAFREAETRALCEVLEESEARIIALGGGTFTLARNRAVISEHDCLTLWLDAPFELCWRRILAEGQGRPLGREPDSARRLYEARIPAYSLAALRVHVEETQSADTIAAGIAAGIAAACEGARADTEKQ